MRKTLQYPAWLPDQPPIGVLTVARNVYASSSGYRPVKSFASLSDPLPAEFKGGASFISSAGTAYLLAGTANGLELFSGGSWSSLLVALSVQGRWRFAQFGDSVVAVNGVDTKQVDLTAGTASDLADAPTGTSVAVVGPHVVIGQSGGNKLLVSWSAFNDHTAWTPAVDQAGFQPMNEGGEVMGIAGGEYGIIVQRSAITRMSLTGDSSAPFQFQQITNNYGAASKASIVQAGRTVFFLSDRGFMALDDGAAIRPIGNEKFDQSFRNEVSPDDYERLWAAVDPKRTLVLWGIPGTPGKIWVYNWVLDKATTIEIPFYGMFSGFENSLTLEQVSALYPNIDTMPYSLDDPRFAGGDPRLYFINDANEIGALSGPNLDASIKMGWNNPFGTNIARTQAFWPVTDATSGVSVTVDARQRMGDPEDNTRSALMQPSGRVPLRTRGRWLAVETAFEAGAKWDYAEGIEIEASQGGER